MSTATLPSTIIGVFASPDRAHQAVEELRRARFPDDHLILMVHHDDQQDVQFTDLDAAKAAQITGETQAGKGAAVGAVAGGAVGGALGLASVLVPGVGAAVFTGCYLVPTVVGLASAVAGGAAGGGLVGALLGLDFPEEEARLYERELKAGRALVGVKAGDRTPVAWEILHQFGGHEVTPGGGPEAGSAPSAP
jgi:hypothetical protein